jgi:hypothetical protein
MPQGSSKKIEFDLLLADLAFEFRNPPLCRRKCARRRTIGWPFRHRLKQSILTRATTRAQRFRTAGTKPISPHVKILPQNLELACQRADILSRQHPANR